MTVDLAAVEKAARNLADAIAATSEGAVLKAGDDENRYLLLVAYPANKVDVAKGLDGRRDIGSVEVVEKAAWSFLRKGAKLGLFHRAGFEDAAVCVESYVWRADPWTMTAADGSTQTVRKGDWLVGAILSPEAWALYKAGVLGGASVQGRAVRRAATAADLAEARS